MNTHRSGADSAMRERVRRDLAAFASLFKQPGMLHRAKYSHFKNNALSFLQETSNASPRAKNPAKNDHKVSTMQPEKERLDRGQWVCSADSAKGSQQHREDDLDSGILYTVRKCDIKISGKCKELLKKRQSK
ncbi:uncharacterized protein [Mobula birostris]|uniref:uncharacterized protein isoform X2 n=1 Tax=Mobula birostris TaxID=1983395 RepID=UPI003B282D64